MVPLLTRDAGVPPPLFTRAFALAWFANAMLNLAGLLFVHLPGFLQQLGAGEAHIGRIMAAQALGAIVAWPLAGRAMDARGRRVVILTGVALFVVVVGLYLSIDSLGPRVYLVRVLDGVAATMWYTALFTYAADLVPAQRRTEGLAMFGVSGLITIGVGAQFGDIILAYATYRELFLGALGCAVLGLMLCLPLRDLPPVHDEQNVPPRSVVATAMQRNLIPVWIASFTFFVAVARALQLHEDVRDHDGHRQRGQLFQRVCRHRRGVADLPGVASRPSGRATHDRCRHVLLRVGCVVLSLAHTPGHVLAAGLLCGAGHGYTFPVLLSLVVARARPQERGVATAFFTTLDWLGLLLAGPVVGYVIERTGYGTAFIGLALLLAMGIGVFYGFDRTDRRS